mgnify:CR=1 FL=1
MIEEFRYRIPLHSRCRVKEVGIAGTIYEHGTDCMGSGHTIYGVRLDEIAWCGGMATEVWHCKGEELDNIISPSPE